MYAQLDIKKSIMYFGSRVDINTHIQCRQVQENLFSVQSWTKYSPRTFIIALVDDCPGRPYGLAPAGSVIPAWSLALADSRSEAPYFTLHLENLGMGCI